MSDGARREILLWLLFFGLRHEIPFEHQRSSLLDGFIILKKSKTPVLCIYA